MPRNSHLTVTADAYTELTNADVTHITVQNLHEYHAILLVATAAGASPSNDDDGAIILPRHAIFVNEALSDLWPGQVGITRIHAKALMRDAKVLVSHA